MIVNKVRLKFTPSPMESEYSSSNTRTDWLETSSQTEYQEQFGQYEEIFVANLIEANRENPICTALTEQNREETQQLVHGFLRCFWYLKQKYQQKQLISVIKNDE